MYVVEDKGGAIALMLAALLFLGTWPAVLTLLERRGRLPQHTYLDYSITNLLAAVVIALTFGQIGDGKPNMPNFLTQLTQDNWPSILFAMAGGVVLSLGNLATQYAWAFVGLSVTEVITSSITVVIGTTMNYFLDHRINRAEILFPGVGCFLIAVCLGSAVHSSNAVDNEEKLSGSSSNYECEKGPVEDTKEGDINEVVLKDLEDAAVRDSTSNIKSERAKFGTAEFLLELERRRSIKVLGSSTFIGLSIVFFAGVCFSLFSPAFNLATNDQWRTLKEGVPHLVVYTAFFYFSVSCFVVAIALNISFLYNPVLGLPKSSFKAYLNDWSGRHWALLAGLLCGFGNGFQFMGGQAAGYAAADAVQVCSILSHVELSNKLHRTLLIVHETISLAARQHILGRSSLWGVPQVVQEDIRVAGGDAFHVHRCCGSAHGLLWAQKNIVEEVTWEQRQTSLLHHLYAEPSDPRGRSIQVKSFYLGIANWVIYIYIYAFSSLYLNFLPWASHISITQPQKTNVFNFYSSVQISRIQL